MRRTSIAALGLLALAASCAAPEAAPEARPVRKPGLENAYWLTDRVLSGAQPEGDRGFLELAALGVRTVISVDGSTPDVERARKHGLRYVHLPIGYDGVPADRALELAKAIEELDGPIYVHCHHGQHRGPAAAVVACVVAGRMDNARALETMKVLGTGPQYIGLWESAREAKRADAAALRDLRVDYRETAPIPPLAEAMVGVDAVVERLQLSGKAGWKTPADHPDVDPPHEALRLREIFTEILRTEDLKARPDEFRRFLEASRTAAERLEAVLRRGEPAEAAFAALKQSCADCHKPYRNSPSRK